MGTIISIFIFPRLGSPVETVHKINAVENVGLEGDLSKFNKYCWNVSFISCESLIEANIKAKKGLLHTFKPQETGINILTAEIELSTLIGKKFRAGNTIFEGVESCPLSVPPIAVCGKKGFRETFAGTSTLGARILTSGSFTIGDNVIKLLL